MSSRAYRFIGKPLPRVEDARLLQGEGRFTDDFGAPDMTYAAIVRSPHAHARIRSIDSRKASAMPGVLAILSGEDAAEDELGTINHNPLPKTRYDMKLRGADDTDVFIGPHRIFPTDKVRHVGEAVAIVIAESQTEAASAVEAVHVEYDELIPVLGTARAIDNAGDPVWDERPDNVLIDTRFGDAAATDSAFETAAHVVSGEFEVSRVTGVPLEPRAALGVFDAQTQRYTLHAGSGGAVKQKSELAGVLNVEPDQVRVFSYDVGGNFGTRNRTYIEFAAVLWASRRVGRPVKYTATRSESFLSDYQGRDFLSRVSLALDDKGHFLALRADNISNCGARCVSLSPLGKGSALITGSYHIPVASLRSRAVFSNTVPTQAYRSSGRPEVTYVIERLIDKAALATGLDALALKRMNLVPSDRMPYVNAMSARYDSGDYPANMDEVLQMIDWDGHAQRRESAADQGRLLGRGFANYVESSIGSPKERAEILMDANGHTTIVIGTQPSGQGHETSFAQVAADLLEIEFADVTVVYSDTDIVTAGGGSHSGRSMRHAGVVIGRAAAQMIKRCRELAAERFEVDAESIEFGAGRFFVPGTDLGVTYAQLAANAENDRLHVAMDNEMHDPVFPNGAAACEVEVDPETGQTQIVRYACVDDVGRCINPLIVHGQAHGAIVQGVGQVMGEQIAIDTQGELLSGSFMDYRMPRAADFPMFDIAVREALSPTNPLGIKAGGEGGTTPALAVYTAAVVDALRDYGVTHLEMPVTAHAIWRAIHTNPAS